MAGSESCRRPEAERTGSAARAVDVSKPGVAQATSAPPRTLASSPPEEAAPAGERTPYSMWSSSSSDESWRAAGWRGAAAASWSATPYRPGGWLVPSTATRVRDPPAAAARGGAAWWGTTRSLVSALWRRRRASMKPTMKQARAARAVATPNR